MFGYIIVNKPELKIRDYETYRSYYCGLCRSLKEAYGPIGQMTLSYDMTFAAVLLSALYEPETHIREARCLPHPLERHRERTNQYTAYAADMNLLLTYYKLLDDWQDEKKLPQRAGAGCLAGMVRRIEKKYPGKAAFIRKKLQEIHTLEETQDPSVDGASGLFGEIMGELLVYEEDLWAPTLREMGFYLGKFIYLMDAYDDRERDAKTHSYNVFLLQEAVDPQEILTMMMAACARAFERLPIVEHAELLRNILYSGVWSRYSAIRAEEEREYINGNESL